MVIPLNTSLSSITSSIETYVQLPNGETASVSHIGTVIISEHLTLENVHIKAEPHYILIHSAHSIKFNTLLFTISFKKRERFTLNLRHFTNINKILTFRSKYIGESGSDLIK